MWFVDRRVACGKIYFLFVSFLYHRCHHDCPSLFACVFFCIRLSLLTTSSGRLFIWMSKLNLYLMLSLKRQMNINCETKKQQHSDWPMRTIPILLFTMISIPKETLLCRSIVRWDFVATTARNQHTNWRFVCGITRTMSITSPRVRHHGARRMWTHDWNARTGEYYYLLLHVYLSRLSAATRARIHTGSTQKSPVAKTIITI